MAYPDNIDSFSTKVDNQDDVMANHINQAQNAITAIENELGTNPKGSKASVKKRIEDIETDLTTYAKKDGTLQTNLNAQKVNGKLYNQMSYEIMRGVDGTILFDPVNVAVNNTEITVNPYYSVEYQTTTKEFTVDCTNINFLQFDCELQFTGGDMTLTLGARIKNKATGIVYGQVEQSHGDGYYAWFTGYADVGGLTGNITFVLDLRLSTNNYNLTIYNRGFDVHKNMVRQVRWS